MKAMEKAERYFSDVSRYLLFFPYTVCVRWRCRLSWALPVLWRTGFHMKMIRQLYGSAFLCAKSLSQLLSEELANHHIASISFVTAEYVLLLNMCLISLGGHRFKSRPRHQLFWPTFSWFPQFLQSKSGTVSGMKHCFLPRSFQWLPFDADSFSK